MFSISNSHTSPEITRYDIAPKRKDAIFGHIVPSVLAGARGIDLSQIELRLAPPGEVMMCVWTAPRDCKRGAILVGV